MPTAQQIVDGLAATANAWVAVAIAWHVVLTLAVVAVLLHWRPSYRTFVALLAALPLSVAVFAFIYGNPFNTLLFLTLALTLLLLARRESREAVRRARWTWLAGIGMIAYGWLYPHFLAGDAWLYVIGAPVGLVPCPSLAIVAGFVLLCSDGLTRATRWTVAAFAAFYAVFGVLRLGVLLDLALFAGALMLALSSVRHLPRHAAVGAHP